MYDCFTQNWQTNVVWGDIQMSGSSTHYSSHSKLQVTVCKHSPYFFFLSYYGVFFSRRLWYHLQMNCILGISIWQTRWSRQEEAGICCGKFRPFNNAQCLQGIVLGKNTWNINQPIQVYTCTCIFIHLCFYIYKELTYMYNVHVW